MSTNQEKEAATISNPELEKGIEEASRNMRPAFGLAAAKQEADKGVSGKEVAAAGKNTAEMDARAADDFVHNYAAQLEPDLRDKVLSSYNKMDQQGKKDMAQNIKQEQEAGREKQEEVKRVVKAIQAIEAEQQQREADKKERQTKQNLDKKKEREKEKEKKRQKKKLEKAAKLQKKAKEKGKDKGKEKGVVAPEKAKDKDKGKEPGKEAKAGDKGKGAEKEAGSGGSMGTGRESGMGRVQQIGLDASYELIANGAGKEAKFVEGKEGKGAAKGQNGELAREVSAVREKIQGAKQERGDKGGKGFAESVGKVSSREKGGSERGR